MKNTERNRKTKKTLYIYVALNIHRAPCTHDTLDIHEKYEAFNILEVLIWSPFVTHSSSSG